MNVLAGERACPPEDCGRIPGYAYLLEVLANPEHPEHDELRVWAGRGFDPEAFDLEAVNRALHGRRRLDAVQRPAKSWITDARHFLGSDGHVAPRAAPPP